MADSRNSHYVIYLVVRSVICLLQIMPVWCGLLLARVLAWLTYRIDRRHRLVATENLQQAFPDLSEAEIDDLVRANYRHVCTMAVETVILMRRLNRRNVTRFVRDENINDAQLAWGLVHSERPTIVMTGHVGNWELMSLAMAMEGGDACVIARRLDNPYLDRYVRGLRESTGIQIIDKDGASEAAAEVLARGGNLGLVGDQDAGPKGLFVPFFGRPASTFKSIALLSLEFQAPILVLGCMRTGEPLVYSLFLEDAIMPERYANNPSAVKAITQRYTQALERIARRHPEQYFWLHRRWKHQPKHQLKIHKPKLAA